MHGFMTPAEIREEARPSAAVRVRGLWKRYKWFALVVLLPTLIVAGYLYAMASDQFESEAHYLVRSQGGDKGSAAGGIGAALGFAGAASGSQGEAMSVSDYLTSHDAVAALRKRMDLVAIFRRPEADLLSRLTEADPTPEALLKYYRKQVVVDFDSETGITTLTARAFRRDDAYKLAGTLLALGEQRVNEMNLRGFADAVALSRRQLDEAERKIASVQSRMTQFRQSGRDVDPAGTAQAQIGVVSRLTQELSAARAQLATTSSFLGESSPQVQALRRQVRSLESQLGSQNARLAGGGNAIAAGLGAFEQLKVEQELLAKQYEAASTSFEQARQQAVRQQLYVVRVVDANRPVKSTYPKRALITLTVFFGLLVTFAIGWLIAAGVREHAV
ncbi:lipopolysaccharide biosynthesis protein [Sphingomonas sp. SUN019]|uniref:lipopolysaccharide biosynthesis protein n=1 Tax=Sphingomonas sp. SUN019 TaxID=2937788 RepID=UPI00216461C2|nr:lipopolysaccharide biosynthesis protein [Sphingomonas sp. SUN019]UVO52384.1 lipopolysaccharide biosynthesis protein [Sphingomonas sp. SUN019]